jgi:hypothetical protein
MGVWELENWVVLWPMGARYDTYICDYGLVEQPYT